jgi:putative membrane protein
MGTVLTRYARRTMMGAAWLGALAAGACKDRSRTADTGEATVSASTDTLRAGMAPADTSPIASADTSNVLTNHPKWSDANIVALLDEANKADSAAGAFAVGKAVDADVKAFARLMMGEHHALRAQGQALAKKLDVTPQPPADDPIPAAGKSEMEALHAAGNGAAFDRAYIDQEVTIHKAVLDLAGRAHDDTSTEELKTLIEKAKPTIQKHLDRAEELQKSLAKPKT